MQRAAAWRATDDFGDEAKSEPAGPTVDVKTLHARIGELALDNDFLVGALGNAGLLSKKKRLTAPTKCWSHARQNFSASAVAVS
ncbi:protein of unknown function (plasmid) [Agrobacterium pusense]|uniref:Transposase n=1 Tax=Agrobacterium pusense TaxID=648995 RepID=U4QIA7_9HYPH|nr:protein of unknown function [Agrobacterium pusense]